MIYKTYAHHNNYDIDIAILIVYARDRPYGNQEELWTSTSGRASLHKLWNDVEALEPPSIVRLLGSSIYHVFLRMPATIQNREIVILPYLSDYPNICFELKTRIKMRSINNFITYFTPAPMGLIERLIARRKPQSTYENDRYNSYV